jgi:hypothetical protein
MIYYPQVKTTNAEIKAISHLKSTLNTVPIVQLTKPRLSKKDPIIALEDHIKRVFNQLKEFDKVIVDITNDESFQDANLNQYILDPTDSYVAWRTRLEWIREEFKDKHIIPCAVGQPNSTILDQYKGQINQLVRTFDAIAIRLPSSIYEQFDSFSQLVEILGLNDLPNESYILFDFEYVKPTEIDQFSSALSLLNSEIVKNGINSISIPLFSSCPASFPMKKKETLLVHSIDMLEYKLINQISSLEKFSYGDYGYIHPKRKEGGGFWYPRVDYPCIDETSCFYSRYFNKETWNDSSGRLRINTVVSNDEAYRELSRKILEELSPYDIGLSSWGKEQLERNVREENVTGKSPQHYISIRSNIHMENILSMIG